MLTYKTTKDVAIQALKGHADDYLEKPLDIEKMLNLIKRFLLLKEGTGSIDVMDTKGKIERVKEFARRNCHKKISLEDAADIVYLSPKYLSRVFKQFEGMGFSEFKLKAKMEKAQDLLKTTGCTVEQISYQLGYENPESFIRIFKKYCNCTPTEYRER